MMLTEEQQAMKTFWRTYMIFDRTLECIRNNDYHDDVKRSSYDGNGTQRGQEQMVDYSQCIKPYLVSFSVVYTILPTILPQNKTSDTFCIINFLARTIKN